MHDHCLLFKADIDILGTANSLANHSVVPTKEVYPWSHGVARSTLRAFVTSCKMKRKTS